MGATRRCCLRCWTVRCSVHPTTVQPQPGHEAHCASSPGLGKSPPKAAAGPREGAPPPPSRLPSPGASWSPGGRSVSGLGTPAGMGEPGEWQPDLVETPLPKLPVAGSSRCEVLTPPRPEVHRESASSPREARCTVRAATVQPGRHPGLHGLACCQEETPSPPQPRATAFASDWAHEGSVHSAVLSFQIPGGTCERPSTPEPSRRKLLPALAEPASPVEHTIEVQRAGEMLPGSPCAWARAIRGVGPRSSLGFGRAGAASSPALGGSGSSSWRHRGHQARGPRPRRAVPATLNSRAQRRALARM